MPSDVILEGERKFFDREAAGLHEVDLLFPVREIERYRLARLRAGNIPKDTFFALTQPLEGKRILDYGCGHGENACLLAACEAIVTAFDLSPGAIAKARRRADMHGLDRRIQFDVRQAGQCGYPPGSFDLVLGYNILHHLHWMLPTIYAEIASVLVPGGTAYFVEPVANRRLLRALRGWIPVPRYATADERQLRYEDFEPLRDYFTSYEILHFYNLERLYRLLGAWARTPLRVADHYLQRLCPWLRPYYGEVLVIARK